MDNYLVDVRFTVAAGNDDAAIKQVRDWLVRLGRGRAVELPPGVTNKFEIATTAQLVEGKD